MNDFDTPPPAAQKPIHPAKKNKKPSPPPPPLPPSKARKNAARIIALVVAVAFVITVIIIVEARQSSFFGEPLLERMIHVAKIKMNGLPDHPDQRAQAITSIPNLLLLPPEAVLPKETAERFKRIGTQFGFVTEDTKLGTKYMCRKSDLKRIPRIAVSIAVGLESFREDLLRNAKLEYIVFCGDIQTEYGSVAGFPAPPNNVMLLNLTNRHSSQEVRELFFHEFYHLFEARHNLVNDMNWMKRFDAGYGNTRSSAMMSASNDRMGTGGFGFMNKYSESHPYEDRAEIFSKLMVSKEELIYFIIKRQDDMLAAKTEYVAQTAKDKMGINLYPLWPKPKAK